MVSFLSFRLSATTYKVAYGPDAAFDQLSVLSPSGDGAQSRVIAFAPSSDSVSVPAPADRACVPPSSDSASVPAPVDRACVLPSGDSVSVPAPVDRAAVFTPSGDSASVPTPLSVSPMPALGKRVDRMPSALIKVAPVELRPTVPQWLILLSLPLVDSSAAAYPFVLIDA